MTQDKTKIIKRLREVKNIRTDSELCRVLGISTGTLANWKKRNSLDYDLILSICEKEDLNYILFGRTNFENSTIENHKNQPSETALDAPSAAPAAPETHEPVGLPLIPYDAMAGLPSIDNPGISLIDCEHYVVPEFQSRGANYLIRVSGSSMYPKYSNGDLLACRRISDILFFQWGKVYVLDTSQGILVKRVQPSNHDNMIRLVSDNAERYQPFDLPTSDIRSLAIVVGVIRFE